MTRLKKTPLIWVCIILAAWYATRTKKVQWEEEVPPNNGETIWVKRTVTYSLKWGAGNPADFGYGQDWIEKIEFNWGGKKYVYKGDADLILLAISPQKLPVLVGPAGNKSWDWSHDYQCTTPHYVQLMPDESGKKWTWLTKIEQWLYGLPANLMSQRRKPEEMKSRYTTQDRIKEDAVAHSQSPPLAKIDPKFTDRDCKKMGVDHGYHSRVCTAFTVRLRRKKQNREPPQPSQRLNES